jgi:hypothetical protein
MAVHYRVLDPAQYGIIDVTTRCTKGECKLDGGRRMPGAGLKPLITQEGTAWKSQPSSRTGENSPYGMIGGIEETSASFEARSAPRSYPTPELQKLSCALTSMAEVDGMARSHPVALQHHVWFTLHPE